MRLGGGGCGRRAGSKIPRALEGRKTMGPFGKIFFPFYNVIEDMVDINSVHVLIFSGKNSVDASNEKRSNMKLV